MSTPVPQPTVEQLAPPRNRTKAHSAYTANEDRVFVFTAAIVRDNGEVKVVDGKVVGVGEMD